MERQARLRLFKFGLTQAEYQRRLDDQEGRCGICGGPPDGRWKVFNVDHDHETKQVRGLLCLRCNRAIGLIGDDLRVAVGLVLYLANWKGKQ